MINENNQSGNADSEGFPIVAGVNGTMILPLLFIIMSAGFERIGTR